VLLHFGGSFADLLKHIATAVTTAAAATGAAAMGLAYYGMAQP
jgi:hypothetical protein